jgi:uncharacterized protein YwgA
MSSNSEDDVMKAAAVLRGIYAALGRELHVETFEDRMRIQKEVYMMKLHPDLAPLLPFEFNMYVRGPYSMGLAKVIWHELMGYGEAGI